MADPSNVSLWPVVVGGLLTMGGVAVTGAVSLGVVFLQQRHDTKKRRAEKFEELVSAVYEHYHWLMRVKDVRLFESKDELGISPMTKVLAISVAYFPSLDAKVRELEAGADAYELWTYQARGRKLAKEANYEQGFKEPWERYLKALMALKGELKTFAEKNLV